MKFSLFPFHQVEKDSRIIIYGAGDTGESFIRQVQTLSYCHIEACVDRRYKDKPQIDNQIQVLNPSDIRRLNFDYIVLATEKFTSVMEAFLKDKMLVPQKKIIVPYNNEFLIPAVSTGRDWDNYYINAEGSAAKQIQNIIMPLLQKYDLLNSSWNVMDFACGRGRIAAHLKDNYNSMILCDISSNALDFCKQRFAGDSHLDFVQSEPESLPIQDESLDFIYSWDAMVHFNYKMLDIYLSEFSRILKGDGYCFIHHSNLNAFEGDTSLSVSENFHENVQWRANVSSKDVVKLSERFGFKVVNQVFLDWEWSNLDCITILQRIKKL